MGYMKIFRLTFICASLVALCSFPAAAVSQEISIESALAFCMEPSKADDRLQCFEALARAAAPEKTKKSEAIRAEINPTNQTTNMENGTIKTVDSVTKTATTKRQFLRFPRFGKIQKSTQKFIFSKPGDKPKTTTSTRQQLLERTEYEAKVLKSWRNAVDDLYVTLDNGQVWKHADPGRPRMPKVNSTVRLKPGLAGSWFMSFSNRSPRIRVRLIKAK